MLTRDGPQRIVKVADFGSARSATSEGYHWAEQGPPTSQKPLLRARPQARPPTALCTYPTPPIQVLPCMRFTKMRSSAWAETLVNI